MSFRVPYGAAVPLKEHSAAKDIASLTQPWSAEPGEPSAQAETQHMCLLDAAWGKERKSKIVLQCCGYQVFKKTQQIGEVPETTSTHHA